MRLDTTGKEKPGNHLFIMIILLGPIAHHTSVINGEKMYLFGGNRLHADESS